MGSLIIALGLLVDDSIIALEMMVSKMETGWDRAKAAAFSYSATAMPRLSGALITVAAFMPVGFAKSTTGEYAGGIFWIVGIAVLVSWLVSGIFTPYLAVKMLPKELGKHHHGADPYQTKGYRRLRGWIDAAIERRWLVIGVTAIAMVIALACMKFVPQQFFPNSTRPELVIDVRVKEGASFAATSEQVKRLESVLSKDEDVRFFTAYTGAGAPRFYLALNPELPNPGYRTVDRDDQGSRGTRARAYAADDARRPEVPGGVGARHSTRARSAGRIPGAVPDRRPGYAGRAPHRPRSGERRARKSEYSVMSSSTGTIPVRTVRIELDQDKVRALGLSPTEVAAVTQTLTSGATLSQLREGEELIDISARAVANERLDIETLKSVNLHTRDGTAVPLAQVARIVDDLEEPVLWRRNRDMAITVRADVKDGEQGVSVTQAIRPHLKDIEAKLPSGYRIDVGGAVEESDKANASLLAVAPVMLVVILLILMLQLQSFSLMAMVFLTAPLGLIGVVAALLVCQAPLGFVAILGIIALSGMIMRNAVILVDQVRIEIDAGRDRWSAVVEAAVQRARPVVLTAAATVLAMVPLTRSVFWGPMAIAIMGGLTVATVLTIFFVPALYAAWFGLKRESAVRDDDAVGALPMEAS